MERIHARCSDDRTQWPRLHHPAQGKKSGRLVKSPFGPSHKPPRFGVPEEIRTPDPTLRRRVLYPAELLGHVYLPNHLSGFLKKCQEAAPKVARFFPAGRIQWEA